MTVAQEAARLLETAAVFVQLGWTTNANARDASGTPVSAEQPDAACWCAQGALQVASHHLGIHTMRDGCIDSDVRESDYTRRMHILNRARWALREAIKEGKHPSSLSAVSITLCLTNWNDDEAEDGDEVSRTMRRAVEILREAAPRAFSGCELGVPW